MNDSAVSFAPALTLLGLLAFLAVALYWARKRMFSSGGGTGANLRMVSQLALGTQQRIVVVEIVSSGGPVQLVLGVTPQQVNTLHVLTTGATASGSPPPDSETTDKASYREIAQAIASSAQEIRS